MTTVEFTFHPGDYAAMRGDKEQKWMFTYKWRWFAKLIVFFNNRPYADGVVKAEIVE